MSVNEAIRSAASPSASLTQDAYEALRSAILSGTVKPGMKLKIREIGDQLSVSQGAVREALSRLTSEGFVLAQPQKGFRVCAISAAELLDLTTTRIHIESLCLRRSIELGDVAWESDLLAAYYALARTPERAGDGNEPRMRDAWSLLHREFHKCLVAASDSPWQLRIRAQLDLQAERYRRLSVPLQVSRRDTSGEHLQIMEAAIGRNATRATECLADHLTMTTKILLNSLNLEDESRLISTKSSVTRKASKRATEHAALASRLVRGTGRDRDKE